MSSILKNVPPATVFFTLVNALIFLYGISSDNQDEIIRNYGFIPDSLFISEQSTNNFKGDANEDQPPLEDTIIRIFTSMFVHGSIAHLLFNLIALVYIGWFAEQSIGSVRYSLIYILAGISGALLHGVIATYVLDSGDILLVGASGAISGVLGIGAAFGNVRAYYWLIIQVVFAFIGSVTAIPIAFSAHIGGFIAGFLVSKLFIYAERKNRKSFSNQAGDSSDLWR